MADLQDVRRELAEVQEIIREVTARVYRMERILQELPTATEAPSHPVRDLTKEDVPSATSGAPAALTIPPRPATALRHAAPDLEARIGSHWLNRIGISAVLIGIAYFLKFAFDNNWIGASGRISIGIVAGIGVVLWSERFRNRGYRAFSFSLKAV